MKPKVGDHVFYWLYYKHPGLHGMKRREALGKIMESDHGNPSLILWCYFERERRLISKTSIIREASALEVFAHQASQP
jgi:hypothetical protein